MSQSQQTNTASATLADLFDADYLSTDPQEQRLLIGRGFRWTVQSTEPLVIAFPPEARDYLTRRHALAQQYHDRHRGRACHSYSSRRFLPRGH